MILDMLKACYVRTGEEAVGITITSDMAELLWDYGERERGGWSKTKEKWLQDMAEDWGDWGEPTLLGLPTRLGSDFEVIGVDEA